MMTADAGEGASVIAAAGVKGGRALQYCRQHIFDKPGIGQPPVFSPMNDVQPYRHALQTMARPCGLEPACHLQRVK
jgi:hypothetical protein